MIMKEMGEKTIPYPSRMRGRGVEVSKTLFYILWKCLKGNKIDRMAAGFEVFFCQKVHVTKRGTPNNRSIRKVLVLFLGVFILQIFKKSVVVHLKKLGKGNQLRYTNIVGSTFNL